MAKPAFTGTTLNTGHSLYTGLKLCVPMLEGSGTATKDFISGNNSIGFTSGCSWTTGVNGAAIQFDGTTGEVSFTPAAACASSASVISIAVGFRATQVSTSMILVEQSGVNTAWDLLIENAETEWRGASASNRFGMASANISVNTYYQWIMQDNGLTTGGGTNVSMTLNGSAQTNNVDASAVAAITTNNTVHLGAYDAGGYYLQGYMDYVYIWNRALTGPEVTALAANPWVFFTTPGGGGSGGSAIMML